MKTMTAVLSLTLCLACTVNLHAQAEQTPKKQTTTKNLASPKQAGASQPNDPAIPKGGKVQPVIKPAVNAEAKKPALLVPEPRLEGRPVIVRRTAVILSPFAVKVREKWLIVDDPTFIAQDPNIQAEAELLRDAYILMSRANADYDGHRIRAMNQTAAAARCLDMTLRGDEPGDEDQSVSDSQLRVARELLNQAQAGLSAKGRPYATQDAGNAIRQIDTALGIR